MRNKNIRLLALATLLFMTPSCQNNTLNAKRNDANISEEDSTDDEATEEEEANSYEPDGNDKVSHKWVTEAVEAPGVRHQTFKSEAIDELVSYHIFIPEAYEIENEKNFPVLYWLHGSGGGLPGIEPVSQFFSAAMKSGTIPSMLIVFPNGLELGMWVNWKDGSVPMETIVIQELIPHIDGAFRTMASREGRIVEGFSMGGYGAARFAFKYPELFWGASLLGAGPLQPELIETPRVNEQRRKKVLSEVYGDDMDYFVEQSPWKLAEQAAEALRANSRIRIVIGEFDETFPANQDFHERLNELEIPHEYIVIPGVGHDTMALLQALGDDGRGFYRIAE